jgi:hypothetical protein
MKEHYNKNSLNSQADSSQKLQPITKETFDFLEKTILRFKKSKQRTNSFLSFTKEFDNETLKQKKLLGGTLEAVNGCGSWLEFRNYIKVDKTKLHKANFCKKDKLCPACAMRRASKQVKKVYEHFEANPGLKKKHWYYIVLPVKHNSQEDFETVFNRTRDGLQSLRNAIKDNRRGKGRKSFFSQFNGLFYSFEVTKTKNGWNNHINLLCCADNEIQGIRKKGKTFIHNDIMRDWKKYTDNESYVHSINKIDVSTDENLIKNLLEVFKYSLKFQDLSNADLLEVYEKTYKKRLIGAFGSLYGIKLDVELEGDDVLGDKFLEIIYRYNFKTKEYFEYSRENKSVSQENMRSLLNGTVDGCEQKREKSSNEEKLNKDKFTPVTIFDSKGKIREQYVYANYDNINDFDIYRHHLRLNSLRHRR